MKNFLKLSRTMSMFVMCLFVLAGFFSPLEGKCPHGKHNPHTQIKMRTAALDTGVTLEYAEKGHGKGNVIIFLHGYTDSWFSYSEVLKHLPPMFHGFALTQRGHGDSEKPLGGYEITDFAADVNAFMDYRRIKRAVVVGHSMGSVIAQRVAIDYPERVKKLVLIGSGVDSTTNGAIIGLKEYVDTIDDPVDPLFVYDFQASTLYNPVAPEFLETVINESLKVPARVWRDALTGLAVVNHTNDLPLITAPTLILWGDKDEVFLYAEQLALDALIPDSTLVIYPDTGHGLHWEYPAEFTRDLVDFL